MWIHSACTAFIWLSVYSVVRYTKQTTKKHRLNLMNFRTFFPRELKVCRMNALFFPMLEWSHWDSDPSV